MLFALSLLLHTALAAEPAETPPTEGEEPSEAEPVAPLPPAPPPPPALTLEALHAEIEALKAELEAAKVERSKEKEEAKKTAPVLPGKGDFRVELGGYYRVRGHVFGAKWGEDKPVTGGLFANQPTSGRYINQRLRTNVKFAYKDTASLNVGVQALDNVMFGDNADIGSNPLFAETPSTTTIDGREIPSIQVFRAWGEFKLPIGVIRVGRQTSHWGLGLLANSGDGFDDDFGENYYSTEFDRFLFATNPIAIAQRFTKKEETSTPNLILAIAVDRLVEDPLTQYYGYKCSPGVNNQTDPDRYDARCDPDGDGLTNLDHGYTEPRDASQRRSDWWADQRDDVWEMVYALMYRGENQPWFGGGNFNVGGYLIHRLQKETDSNVVVGDLFVDLLTHGVGFQFEGVGIWGKTRALSLPDSTQDDPLAKKASIYGYSARLFYQQPYFKVLFESGLASGDNQVNNADFTGRALHPDYNVGLLLYEEVIARVTQNIWLGDSRGLRSRGGVYDSHYIFPRITGYPIKNLSVIGGFLMAWPDKADGAIVRCTPDDQEKFGCAAAPATSKALGWEADFAIKYRYLDHLNFTLETGYAHATDRLALSAAGLATNDKGSGNYWTFQSRIAWEF